MEYLNEKMRMVVILMVCTNLVYSYVANRDMLMAERYRREAATQPPVENTVDATKGEIVADTKQESPADNTTQQVEQVDLSNQNQESPANSEQQPNTNWDHRQFFHQQWSQGFHGNQYDPSQGSDVTPDPDLHPTPDPDLHPTPDPDVHHEAAESPHMLHNFGSDHQNWFTNPLHMSRPGEMPPMALPQTSGEHGGDATPTGEQNQEQQAGDQHAGETQQSGPDGNQGSQNETQAAEGHEMPQALPLTGHSEGHEMPKALPLTGQAEGHEMPKALPMTGHSESHVAPRAAAQKAERPAPNWGRGTGVSRQAAPQTAGAGAGASGATESPNMFQNMAAMQAMGGGDMFSNMMEMQRKMYQNYPPQEYMKQYQDMYRQMFPNLFGGPTSGAGGATEGEGGAQNPMMPMYAMGMEDGGFMGGDNMRSMYMMQHCKQNPDEPMCKMSQWNMAGMGGMGMGGMGMFGEAQFEGPMGEMDFEPGEIDLEGPMAYELLKRFNMSPANVHPHHQEITLNQHVLGALKRRFNINTTAGIQAKAADPEFQAFMFQVLKHSRQVAPGEYNANLTQAQVNTILAGLNGAATGINRIPPTNLDHATIARGVLTMDNPKTQPINPFGAQAQAAQPGTFQALVAPGMGTPSHAATGEGGEAGEVGEPAESKSTKPQTKATNQHSPTEASKTQQPLTDGAKSQPLTADGGKPQQAAIVASGIVPKGAAPSGAVQSGITPTAAGSGVAPSSALPLVTAKPTTVPLLNALNALNIQPTQQLGPYNGNTPLGAGFFGPQESRKPGKGQEIRNKDEIPGLSKDARNRAFGKLDKVSNAPMIPVTPIATPMATDNRPIGMQEAGIFPGSNGTVPVTKPDSGYSTSTAFAIAAIVLIALTIIIGPIICMLCKMKEKREERNRKLKALKNREVSENNIMEAMMLHEFGATGRNSFSNEGATGGNFYKNEPTRYDTIDPEIECLNQSRPLP